MIYRLCLKLDESSFDLSLSIKNAVGIKNKRLYNITANSDKESFSVTIKVNANNLFALALVFYPYERRIH